ncbi:hypothetical protein C2E21_3493 [Chlorella sorokiniana]|uniref:Uncharacterized protein n=1 Tax=Chlorella sorokiniana TaxID=3076 RepID=A0A2P6TUI2_CHLSO|nr:hypothetical protein C2E21_3493 [Chlorella sorokiniana]|eukprot:PRW57720.1 hypothetical protein C2E21_3493 [Chlorella sorokiniana]
MQGAGAATMKPCLLVLLIALALGCAAGEPLPKFNKLANEGAPAFLQGLFVADKNDENATSLSSLMLTSTPWQLSQEIFNPSAEEPVRTSINAAITSWECYNAGADDSALAGAILFISEGNRTTINGEVETGQEWCWLVGISEDGKTLKKHVQRSVDSQSSEAGGYNPDCPGRVHGGAINFPTPYTLVANKVFPTPLENPCRKA